jgi:homoserine acetyltransferase
MVALYNLNLSYQVFWSSATCSIIVINVTGNSQVVGESGWWNDIMGIDKTIDTRK